MGHADVLTTHAKAALTHAQAGEKAKANPHTDEAIKHLEQAIDEGKKGHAVSHHMGNAEPWARLSAGRAPVLVRERGQFAAMVLAAWIST